jgi:hypothetical protein
MEPVDHARSVFWNCWKLSWNASWNVVLARSRSLEEGPPQGALNTLTVYVPSIAFSV